MSTNTQATQATQATQFNADQGERIKAAAIKFAQSEVFGEEAVKSTAEVMGTAPTYSFWGLVMTQFVTCYMQARKCSEEAAEKAGQRLARRMKDAYGLEKPKAPSLASGKKAEARAKTEKALTALVKKHKSEAMLQRMAGEAMEAGKAEIGYQLIEAAKVAKRQAEATAKDQQKVRWEKVAEKIKAAKKLHDEKTLTAVEKVLATTVPTTGTK
jgi:hypothetical protein